MIAEPFLTVAGQTAPGDGICFRGQGVEIRTHDVVVRHLRFRPGDVSGVEVDGLAVGSGDRRVVLDHCSAGWSVDESLSLSGDVADVTVQWYLIAEALNRSVHRKGPHGYGSLVRAVGGVTLHHNLWAHNSCAQPAPGRRLRPPALAPLRCAQQRDLRLRRDRERNDRRRPARELRRRLRPARPV